MNSSHPPSPESPGSKDSGLKLFLIVFGAVFLALLLAALAIRLWLFPAPHKPVTLDHAEKISLNQKLQSLGYEGEAFPMPDESGSRLQARPYSETSASRQIRLSQRELNALIGRNPRLASQLAIHLGDDLASARLVMPLDPDLPFLGGQTLRMSAGLQLALRNERPIVILKGISMWGVPLPNAWLGNLKNVDLVAEFGDQPGFWRGVAEGVEEISVRDGELLIRLRE